MSAWLPPPFPSVQTARGTGDSVAHGRVVFTSVNPGRLDLLVVLEPVKLTVSAITIITHTVQTGWGQPVDSTSPEAG